ncbi:glycosyltransferase family 2 protein [Blastochloris sulfoviridis]|uniref:Glycosyltransferase family 2 protein n=1 Tax=Blastochloris sulfoviridis TaxID=50712 RepID=A0A5M6I3U9_9HYPH|nr:glycosyltransferase family 2 protein [Blastochloris sulfoviridis]KAA5602537.1 glycosyltransferase family 2 protein [Blastochloris sulfoviridis]
MTSQIMAEEKCQHMSARPKVSIGVPVHNGAQYIQEALESVLAQNFNDFEVIISDNASKDATEEICEKICRKDPRFHYIRQGANIGMIRNFEFVAAHARGEYFAFLAHDDALLPDFLQDTSEYLDKNLAVVAVSGDSIVVDSYGVHLEYVKLESIRAAVPWRRRRRRFFIFPCFPDRPYFSIYGLMRTEVVKGALKALRDKDQIDCTDTKIMAIIATYGQIVSIPYVLRKYRIRDASESKQIMKNKIRKAAILRIIIRNIDYVKTRISLLNIIVAANISIFVKLEIIAVCIIINSIKSDIIEFITLPNRANRRRS